MKQRRASETSQHQQWPKTESTQEVKGTQSSHLHFNFVCTVELYEAHFLSGLPSRPFVIATLEERLKRWLNSIKLLWIQGQQCFPQIEDLFLIVGVAKACECVGTVNDRTSPGGPKHDDPTTSLLTN